MSTLIIVSLIIIFVVIALILLSLINKKADKWKPDIKAKLSDLDSKYYNSNDIILVKSGLIELDKLYDHTLKMSGFKGETMGERLKNAKTSYDKKLYNEIWEAHKYRNKIVHEVEFTPIVAELKKHYWNLRKGLISLL